MEKVEVEGQRNSRGREALAEEEASKEAEGRGREAAVKRQRGKV